MKIQAIIFYLFICIILQGCCYCCFFAGGQGSINDKAYFPFSNNNDTIGYFAAMVEIGNKYPQFKLDSIQVNKYFKDSYFSVSEKKYIYESGKLYPLYPLISCPFKEGEYCRSKWYIKSVNNDLIFELGLYHGGFALNSVNMISNEIIEKNIGRYALCDMSRKERIRLRKDYVNRFETEILPLMQPYFESIEKK